MQKDGLPPEDEEAEKKAEKWKNWKKRGYVFLSISGWWLVGAAIFMATEQWEYFDSFYFAFVTLSTIGYGDFYPTSSIGMNFLIFYSLTGLGLFAFALSTLTDTSDELGGQMEELKNTLKVDKLKVKGISSMTQAAGGRVTSFAKKFVSKDDSRNSTDGRPKSLPSPIKGKPEETSTKGGKEAPKKPPAKQVKKPEPKFKVLDKEEFDKFSNRLTRALKKIHTCEESAFGSWIQDYLKNRELFEATFIEETKGPKKNRKKSSLFLPGDGLKKKKNADPERKKPLLDAEENPSLVEV